MYLVLGSLAFAFGSTIRGIKKATTKKKTLWGMGSFSLVALLVAIIAVGFAISFGVYLVGLFLGYMVG